MTSPFGTPRAVVPRHGGNNNPLVLLPEFAPDPDLAAILQKKPGDRTSAEARAVKGKCAYYSRPSSFGKAIEDDTTLTKWRGRMVAIGLANRPDLVLSVGAHAVDADANKRVLNDLCEDAIDAARAGSAANVGTALHKMTEYVDKGIAIPATIAESAHRDLDAYRECMARHGVTHHRTEQFVVCDELGAAGSFDRFMSMRSKPGRVFVGDIKTGNTAKDYQTGAAKRDEHGRPILAYVQGVAVQLAIYANAANYDPTTGERTPLDVDREWAIIIHLPQGLASCELWRLDLSAGWEAARLAHAARAWQSRHDLVAPITAAA